MKVLKLAITFILILGAVVGALYWFNGEEITPPPPPPDNLYEEVRAEIENDWEQTGDWDESLFMSKCDLLDQLSAKYETTTLRDLNTRTAAAIVHEKIFNEWQQPQCKKPVVDKYYNALNVIESKDANAMTDPNVKQIKDVYQTYSDAVNLANKRIGLIPTFDGTSWNSFKTYSNQVMNQRSSMLNNTNYTAYLSNISDIKNGLNAIPNRLDSAKKDFYNTLASKIINHYSRTEPSERTREELNALRNVNSRYQAEYTSNQRLSDFLKAYSWDVIERQQ